MAILLGTPGREFSALTENVNEGTIFQNVIWIWSLSRSMLTSLDSIKRATSSGNRAQVHVRKCNTIFTPKRLYFTLNGTVHSGTKSAKNMLVWKKNCLASLIAMEQQKRCFLFLTLAQVEPLNSLHMQIECGFSSKSWVQLWIGVPNYLTRSSSPQESSTEDSLWSALSTPEASPVRPCCKYCRARQFH